MTKPQVVLTLDSLRGEGHEKDSCKMARVIRTLSPENQIVLGDALHGLEAEYPSTRIVGALKYLDITVATDTVIKHRRGTCACKKPLGGS